ncbi:CDP-glycerol glycerophosphotransferase family protein [uncultured Ruminococcus sp.]|uniref:CDP-glycerol glycerophosphotransferase family protein n=1 Tax=uncultured Ruminococcus sp. TaxID=165186 RepID=UPI0025DCD611|nr:CDP-glycerol glycerophosphotransferase family protein [uncultured Ruminococcus sp.]
MDNTRQDLEEIYGNRRETINDLKKRNKKFAELTRVEFKRIILHIEGDLIGFEPEDLTDLTARFITQDRSLSFPAQSFELSGRHFHLWVNMMSANKEMPIETGNYILKIFKKYKGMNEPQISSDATDYVLSGNTLLKNTYDKDGRCLSKQVLTHEYSCIISDKVEAVEDDTKDNPMNFKIRRGAENLFYAESKSDLDSLEYYLAVTYKEPKPSQTLPKRLKKMLSNRKKLIVRDLYGLKKWGFRRVFNLFTHFAKKNGDIILFASGSRAEIGGNEKVIYDRMVERGLDSKFKFRFDFKASISVNRSIPAMIRFAYYLATSDIILVDDYYPDIYLVDYPKHIKILQVWHACGAFKSVGFERLGKSGAPAFNTKIHKCYTHVPVSSYHSALHNAEGFAIDIKKFYPVGIPRTDIFFDEEYKKKTRAEMLEVFSECKDAKTVYMYAPTFRGDNANNAYFPFDRLDLESWGKFLKETDSVLIVKLHPFVRRKVEIPEQYKHRILDASSYREVNDILFIVDVLITDYSSIIYEMSLLKKPMLFFAFDQKHYEATRDFYEPYEDLVPGKIVHNFDDLMTALRNKDYEFEKMDGFIKKNFTYTDGKSTDRVIDQLILGQTPDNK